MLQKLDWKGGPFGPEKVSLEGPDTVLVAQFPGDDLGSVGLEECLGLVSGFEVLPHAYAVRTDLDVHDVVVGFHGVGCGLSDLDEDSAVDLLEVGDVLVLVGDTGLGLQLDAFLSAADGGTAAGGVGLLVHVSAFGTLVGCHAGDIRLRAYKSNSMGM